MIADFLVCDPVILQDSKEKEHLKFLIDFMKKNGWEIKERASSLMDLDEFATESQAVFVFGFSPRYLMDENLKVLPPFLSSSDFVSSVRDQAGGIAGEVYQKRGTFYFFFFTKLCAVREIWKSAILPYLSDRYLSISLAADIYIPLAEGKDKLESQSFIEKFSSLIFSFEHLNSVLSLHVLAHGKDESDARKKIEQILLFLRHENITCQVQWIVDRRFDLFDLLRQHPATLAAAESCTGGLIGKMLTDLPGSSEFFKGTAVTYWNEAKHHLLQVSNEDLQKYTAVSAPVAKEMAEGARNLYHTDLAVSTTGYAGPGLGERGEEPGLVYIGVSSGKGAKVFKEQWYGSRAYVRYCAALRAIQCFYDQLHVLNV